MGSKGTITVLVGQVKYAINHIKDLPLENGESDPSSIPEKVTFKFKIEATVPSYQQRT